MTIKFHFVLGGEEQERTLNTHESRWAKDVEDMTDRLKACGATGIWWEEDTGHNPISGW